MERKGTVDTKILEDILEKNKKEVNKGNVADYIPELKKVDPKLLGFCITDMNGKEYKFGDYDYKFTIQSISKIITLTCCLLDNSIGEIKEKVSFEPTANAFNSIVDLETKNSNKPLNPFINSGAIICVSLMKEKDFGGKFCRVLDLIRALSGNNNITYNKAVYESERATGSRNRSLAYYMQSTGIIGADVDLEKLLDTYFKICSIEINTLDLSRIALVFANDGVSPITNKRYFSKEIAKIVNATMSLCGMYNESGEVAVSAGVPSKSGVGGGILSVVPRKMGIGIFSPSLNKKGSSVAGVKVLEMISKEFDLSIY